MSSRRLVELKVKHHTRGQLDMAEKVHIIYEKGRFMAEKVHERLHAL